MSRLGTHLLSRTFRIQTYCVKICGSCRYESTSQKVPPNTPENPLTRTARVLKDDITNFFKSDEEVFLQRPLPSYCDVLVIGGGIMGSSIAYWLKQGARHALNVVVVEKDPMVRCPVTKELQYAAASTVLSAGGIRQQFSLPENIEMSLFGADFLRNIKRYLSVEGESPPDVSFCPTGYLFLATEKGAELMESNHKLQQKLGAKSELLSATQLKEKFKWINTHDIVLGCHGLRNEGWFDPWSLLSAFKRKAVELGAEYVKGEAVGFDFVARPDFIIEGVEPGTYESLDKLHVELPSGEIHSIKFSLCVIAAGPHSGKVAKMARIGEGPSYLRYPLPVEPRKRYVYCFHCPNGPGLDTPLVVDPTGAYFRREGLGGNYIGGRSPNPDQEPSCDNLDVDHQFFDDHVWPHLANRVSALENIKVQSSWAGFYEYNTFDANGIVGPHPSYHNLYIATGFSGHGIQHGPAVGRAIAELIIDGDFLTIDLKRLSFDRIITGDPILENNIW